MLQFCRLAAEALQISGFWGVCGGWWEGFEGCGEVLMP